MDSTRVQPERIPIFSKRTHKLLFRISEEGVWGWCKINKEWELATWEELRTELEVHKGKQVAV